MKRHIPNALTCCNLLCGCLAMGAACYQMLDYAMGFIVLGAVFDFFDGFAARLLHVSSPIGKELDSLADVVTFGAAPAAMVVNLLWFVGGHIPTSDSGYDWISYCSLTALLIAAFSALRLAKFNLDTRQTTSFIGLPTPANALFWGGLAVYLTDHLFSLTPTQAMAIYFALLLLVAVFCGLLVSEIPMFALKFKHFSWKENEVRYLFLLSCIVLLGGAFALGAGVLGVSLCILLYILVSTGVHRFTSK